MNIVALALLFYLIQTLGRKNLFLTGMASTLSGNQIRCATWIQLTSHIPKNVKIGLGEQTRPRAPCNKLPLKSLVCAIKLLSHWFVQQRPQKLQARAQSSEKPNNARSTVVQDTINPLQYLGQLRPCRAAVSKHVGLFCARIKKPNSGQEIGAQVMFRSID